jgi:hypothetical protein
MNYNGATERASDVVRLLVGAKAIAVVQLPRS